jgi:uncharacterized LabA/DUF88 family protein
LKKVRNRAAKNEIDVDWYGTDAHIIRGDKTVKFIVNTGGSIDEATAAMNVQTPKRFGAYVNYQELTITVKVPKGIATKIGLVRTYFFCTIKPSKTQDVQLNKATTFLNWLKLSGIEAVSYPLKTRDEQFHCPRCGLGWREKVGVEKGVDVALVTKLLALGFKGGFDTAIVVSGDADYIEAVREIKNLGKRIEIAAFRDSASKELAEAADRFTPLDDFGDQIKTPVSKPLQNRRPDANDRRTRQFRNRERFARH